MHLTRLSIERYKCFAQREDIEIRPLTLLIGRNSSGKSVLARLPLLLRHALSGQSVAPLDLEVEGVTFGGSFVDLVNGRDPHGAVGLGFRAEDGRRSFSDWWVEIQHLDEKKLQIIKRLDVVDDRTSIHLAWNLTATSDPSRPRYDGVRPDEASLISFSGIVPKLDDRWDSIISPFASARLALNPLRHLGPFRQVLHRDYGYPGGQLRDVGPNGTRAPEILGGDAIGRDRRILEEVARFYRAHLGGWNLDVEERGDRFSLVVRSPGDRETTVNLVDAGVGLSQVLPLVVQRALDATSVSGDGVEIVEQPELHLHPAAHAALADLYVEAIKRRPSPRFIIETHSENFVLRIRRRIAENQISADDVALHWIDDSSEQGSRARPIPIDASGEVADWPRGVFSEDFEEVKAMRRAQQRRSP